MSAIEKHVGLRNESNFSYEYTVETTWDTTEGVQFKKRTFNDIKNFPLFIIRVLPMQKQNFLPFLLVSFLIELSTKKSLYKPH